MAGIGATINVELHFTLNGEPVTRYLKMPGEVEDMGRGAGLTVHLHLDARELAKALAPHIARELPGVIRNSTGMRH